MDEAQAGVKISGRNIHNLSYADDTTLMAESEELKCLLMKVKEKTEKVGLKFTIQKTKIMASGPITPWQIDGETMETVRDYFLGFQNQGRWWCSHEIKRCLVLGRKALTNSECIFKSRDITLPTKVHQSYGFSSSHVWMWELAIKKAECQKLMHLNWGVGEASWESLGLQGDPASQS